MVTATTHEPDCQVRRFFKAGGLRVTEADCTCTDGYPVDRPPSLPLPPGQHYAPKLLHSPGACGLCDALREEAG
jgi:hypothetical protein